MRLVVLVLLAISSACSPPVQSQVCSSLNCAGCCDAAGTCQAGV